MYREDGVLWRTGKQTYAEFRSELLTVYVETSVLSEPI